MNQSSIITTNEGNFISLYNDSLTNQCVATNIAKIKASFPALSLEFFSILADRIKEKGFTDKRLIDAVNHVIDNCTYPTPTMAQFLSFDKRKKLYTYNELCKIVTEGEKWQNFEILELDGIKYWTRKNV